MVRMIILIKNKSINQKKQSSVIICMKLGVKEIAHLLDFESLSKRERDIVFPCSHAVRLVRLSLILTNVMRAQRVQ